MEEKLEKGEKPERRSKVNILHDMLYTIQNRGGRAKPTHILYGANLSHDRLRKYLELLEAEGFVKRTGTADGGQVFEITQKGLEFLGGYNKMKKFFDAFGFSI